MPRSVPAYGATENEDGTAASTTHTRPPLSRAPSSPTVSRRPRSIRTSDIDLRSHLPNRGLSEHTSLLSIADRNHSRTTTAPPTPKGYGTYSRRHSVTGQTRAHSRAGSVNLRISSISERDRRRNLRDPLLSAVSRASIFFDERVWYDQFTSTDWVHDSIADGYRVRELKRRRDIRGRFIAWFDGAQGWILVAVIGIITAMIAYLVDVTETTIFDLKEGYCTSGWYFNRRKCCFNTSGECSAWRSWSEALHRANPGLKNTEIEFAAYVLGVVVLAVASCFLTLSTKTIVPSAYSLSTLDENLGAVRGRPHTGDEDSKRSPSPTSVSKALGQSPAMIYYSAAGSGVAEVKVILSGFVLHGYLGLRTLIVKTLALILSVASGLSLGKEGPFVHIATCVGNIACRMFSKYNHNDAKRREVLSAAAASGVAVAFGAPIGGVLFSLEEVSYYFPPKTLFRTFFCCIAAALSLKFLNPYGTGKIVLFEVRYVADWRTFEIVVFIVLGILGGALGALFIKASRLWAQTFRRIPLIKQWPMLEVVLVAVITGLISFWNRYTKLAVTELLFELASPCDQNDVIRTGLCPLPAEIPGVIGSLCIAFVTKALLTTITFGIKVPAGIYVPSMVVGGLMGRIVGHTVQYLAFRFPGSFIFGECPAGGGIESCVTPGVYALVAAGATMCGVTRLSVTLAVILFELTGSLEHVLPFSLAVLVSKWTADALEPLSIYVSKPYPQSN